MKEAFAEDLRSRRGIETLQQNGLNLSTMLVRNCPVSHCDFLTRVIFAHTKKRSGPNHSLEEP